MRKSKTKEFLKGLFWYEKELPMLYVIKQCAERFGSTEEGLYVVADAISDGILLVDAAYNVGLG